ncbi:SDR family NAD(P)-dependent oxidoreductase [Mycolicibacter sinensis]|uniref:Ketoreductase domain-containing protein n=1 Tax=Mycolicibacter sinensis (strain JDM601) TaxID=875328 RepID=A0A1A3TRT5_MYCSD|nr:SDR family NAD(P)-dependent oxidoreductase [Mycolicibacter sinensis]OBK85072.1 hypothetical protein A5648_08190 [Mycolicibacter sinensis]
MSTYNLTAKVILITGASGGIGAASARLLTAKGAKVALVDLSGDAVTALAAQLPAGSSLPIAADVTDVDQMTAAIERTIAEFGRLDVVWANAGIANNPPVTLATADLTSYERVIEVDLLGVVRTIKPALPQIIENKGQVIITGSGYSFVNAVLNSAYGASKAGVEMLGRCLRAELAPYGASASVLYPGWTKTPITDSTKSDDLVDQLFKHFYRGPLGHFSEPEVIAAGLVTGLQKRSPRIFAPRPWSAYSALRGILNPLTDALVSRDKFGHDLIQQLEVRRRAGR